MQTDDKMIREVDEWISRPLPPGVEDELERLRREERNERESLGKIQARLDELSYQIAKLEDALKLREYVGYEIRRHGPGDPAPALSDGRPPNRGREAVLQLLSESSSDKEWTIAEIVKSLAARGWAEPDDTHAVSVSLSRLARAAKVRRPRKGIYMAAPGPTHSEIDPRNVLLGSEETGTIRLSSGSGAGEAGGEGS